MKEQLISFETAKLASEKGFFKKPSEHGRVIGAWYNEKGVELGRVDVDDKGQEINFRTYGKSYEDHYLKSFYAPTQTLLQKWFREKYKIYVTVTINILTAKCDYEIFQYNDGNEIEPVIVGKTNTDDWDLEFEEALEEGLQEVLKLIKS